MARKTASRLEKRKELEAAEKQEAPKKKKKAAKKKATTRAKRAKVKVVDRKRLVWGIFSGSMKEEARFPYDQLEAAETKIQQLKLKGKKKLYFIQPIKEIVTDALPE